MSSHGLGDAVVGLTHNAPGRLSSYSEELPVSLEKIYEFKLVL